MQDTTIQDIVLPETPKYPCPKGGGIPKAEGNLEMAKSFGYDRLNVVHEYLHDYTWFSTKGKPVMSF